MSVSVTDNHPKIKLRSDTAINLALRLTVDDIDRAAFYITPKDQGELRKNLRKNVSSNTGTIEWRSYYAQYQERGYSSGPIKNYTTPGTGAHFAERAVQKGINKLLDNYLKSMGII